MDERIEKHLYDVLNAANEVEEFFEGKPKIYVIVDVIRQFYIFEIYYKINVTLIIESVCKNRAKHKKIIYLMFLT